MSSILKRSISGIVYVALIVGSLLCSETLFALLCLVFGILAMIEYKNLTATVGEPAPRAFLLDMIAAIMMLGMGCIAASSRLGLIVAGVLLVIYAMVRLLVELYHQSETPLTNVGRSFVSMLWIVFPLCMLQSLTHEATPYFVLVMFIMIWLNDTGAFCAGSLFGRHKLFERISPKKTWEGFWGGLAVTALFGYFAMLLFPIGISPIVGVIYGILVSIAATFGDLVESMFKRALHVKDSGNIMPGHGGILDRIDSLLFVAPTTTILFYLIFSFSL